MRIQSLDIKNFRAIRQLHIDFQDKLNVLEGDNGAGKSSILDCVANVLSWLPARVRTSSGAGRKLTDDDITNDESETSIRVTATYQNEDCTWTVSKTRKGRARETFSEFDRLKEVVAAIHSRLKENRAAGVPLFVLYPVNRSVLDIPLRIREKHSFAEQIDAYENALVGAKSNFRLFFEWFREREDLENERRLDPDMENHPPRGSQWEDPQLRAVRRAIESIMPGYSNLRVRRMPHRMTLNKKHEVFTVNQLSDGEKCLLAMVGDMARRLAIANPGREDALNGSGIVLIDEIDLHLHPAWQRSIIPSLTKTFPNCQFVVSTHSPQVLSHVQAENIMLLRYTRQGIEMSQPTEAYGQDSCRILEDLMHVPGRPQEIKDRLSRLFLVIEEGNLQEARTLVNEIRNKIGTDPKLVKAETLIRRKETVGK
ncbi:MAG: AAA family ATPase [Phycisphaerae bacterium]|nr:AAA family ATPase [Phycisphaerae bacterium]